MKAAATGKDVKKDDIVQDYIAPDGKAVYACRPSESRGRLHAEPPSKTRDDFHRDRDRVIHCNAFRRLKHKTQVFVANEGDHYRTRLTHSIEVAQVARSLARSLGLNEDLAETAALAHDLGHTPFAHVGEDALKECMEPYGGFDHNDQTLRVVTILEQRYPRYDGLNLTWESLEGLVKHNGPARPKKGKDTYEITLDWLKDQMDLQLDTYASAEAQAAALADDIAYNSHDLDDGLSAGFFTLDDLAELPWLGDILGEKREKFPDCPEYQMGQEVVREVMGNMIIDVMAESRRRLEQIDPQSPDDIRNAGRTLIAFSDDMIEKDKVLRGFLWERFYRHPDVSRMRHKVFRVVQDLFNAFMEHRRCLPLHCQARADAIPDGFDEDTWRARVIADYIASMTDRKALLAHRDLFDLHQAIK